MNLQAQAVQKHFEDQFKFEIAARQVFNEEHSQYLPTHFKEMLVNPPTLFSVYPKHLQFTEGGKSQLDEKDKLALV